MIEIWKDIDGYEGEYQVSNLGRVKSNKSNGHILTPFDNGYGYLTVKLSKHCKVKKHKVHRLVAIAFLDNPNHQTDVNHKDGNKHNNNKSNLEWCSRSHNLRHAYGTGLRKTKKVIQKTIENNVVNEWENMQVACQRTGANISHVWQCCNGERKTANGYVWEYAN